MEYGIQEKKKTQAQEFILGENRYASLKQQFPGIADELFNRAEAEAKDKYDYYKKLNDME